ncbi:inverse autotransporter beta domain-containing protein [Photobacterium leiognathi subsp. mandapamensis]|uniref:inverse autotransporter beta domain-containing protein n=1 Tax=Photobacterium leiognathi TaxID=553611 RepID=UPI003AF369E3
MNRVIIFSLLTIGLCLLTFSPTVNSYPLLSYSVKDGWILSSKVQGNSISSVKSSIYLHIYSRKNINLKRLDNIIYSVKHLSPSVQVKVLDDVPYWLGNSHRVIIGPVKPEFVTRYSQILKKEGINNIPIYLNESNNYILTNTRYDKNSFVKNTTPQKNIIQSKKELTQRNEDSGKTKKDVFKYSSELSTVAKTITNITQSKNTKDSILSYARSKTESYTANYVQDWLSQYGTAQVKTTIDNRFNLKSGEIDLLVPFMSSLNKNKGSTWFVQSGIVINDNSNFNGRDFVHVGVGYRIKNDDSFYGVNAFYDYDLVRAHQRVSIGAEYARDFIKLSGNYYLPLSNWKDSPELFKVFGNTKLKERSAKGFDINAKVYLPNYPHLFLTTQYQQFFGDYIEVSNGKNPTNNLYQLSTDLNYQPIPMLTVRTGYKHEKGGYSGINLGANIDYRFGVPFNKQIDPSQSVASNSLTANLFDLVDRDHNIRLEYKKKKIDFKIEFNAKNYRVKEGSETPVDNWIVISGDKSIIKKITFNGTAAKHLKKQQIFLAPHYKEPAEHNEYELSVTVTLNTGEVITSPVPARVVVEKDTIGLFTEYSAKAINPISPENPISKVGKGDDVGYTIRTVIKNSLGRPLVAKEVVFNTRAEGAMFSNGAQTQKVHTNNNGVVIVVLKSVNPGTVKFNIKVDQNIAHKALDFAPGIIKEDSDIGTPSVLTSKFIVEPATIMANGVDTSKLTLQLKDTHNKPISDQVVVFNSSEKIGITVSETTNNKDGSYSATLKGTKAGITNVTVTVGNSAFEVKAQTVTLTADKNKPVITFPDFDYILYAQGAPKAITVTLEDIHGNPIAGELLTIRGEEHGLVNGTNSRTLRTDSHGKVNVMLSTTDNTTDLNIDFTVIYKQTRKTRSGKIAYSEFTMQLTNDTSVEIEYTYRRTNWDGYIESITIGNPRPNRVVTIPRGTLRVMVDVKSSSGFYDTIYIEPSEVLSGKKNFICVYATNKNTTRVDLTIQDSSCGR